MKRIRENKVNPLKICMILLLIIAGLPGMKVPAQAGPPVGEVVAGAPVAPVDDETYASEGNYFTVGIPRGWEKSDKKHPYGDLTKITGIKLTGPVNRDGAHVTLSILYYSGDGIFPTPEAFIRNSLNSFVRTDYDKAPAMNETRIAGMPGKRYQIRTFELVYLPVGKMPPPPEGGRIYEIVPPHVKVNMVQQFIVIPAKRGFYVLRYGAPEDEAARYQPVFEKVVASFKPLSP